MKSRSNHSWLYCCIQAWSSNKYYSLFTRDINCHLHIQTSEETESEGANILPALRTLRSSTTFSAKSKVFFIGLKNKFATHFIINFIVFIIKPKLANNKENKI
jgi:hypothetical protein